MNAVLLADLLLEMNLLNPADLKREVRKLGAHVSDPRARGWFMRTIAYWLVNIDKLLATPYKATAEPRNPLRGSKYNYLPTGQWAQKPPEDTKSYRFKTGRECLVCHGSGKARNEETGEELTCPTCKGSGMNPNPPETAASTWLHRREGHFPESLASYLLDEAVPLNKDEPFPPAVQPPADPEGTYTSNLHQPDIERHIKQNFTPFKPSQAKPKAKTSLGDPWPKEQVPTWATDDKDLYHFNPIQVRRRELFQRLEGLVNYLNYKHALASYAVEKEGYAAAEAAAAEDGPENLANFKKAQDDARQAKDFFRNLETMKTEDIDGFRRLLRESEQFGRDVVEQPWLYDKGSVIMARAGDIKVIKITSAPLAQQMSRRPINPPYVGHGTKHSTPTWCTGDSRAGGYLSQGPLYFIDKKNQPYVLLHTDSGQCKLPANDSITPAVAKIIAPAIAKSRELSQIVRAEGGNGEVGILANALNAIA